MQSPERFGEHRHFIGPNPCNPPGNLAQASRDACFDLFAARPPEVIELRVSTTRFAMPS